MGAERMQTVAEAFERWNREDFEGASEYFTSDCEWRPQIGALDAKLYSGREALAAMFRDISEDLKLSLNFRHMEAIGDKVLVEVFARPIGDAGGASVEDDWFQLYSFREGEICKVEPFESRDDAIAAAG
jgi:ketosteroid isomerase-like protein